MSLLPWDEENKKDELEQARQAGQVRSVQQAWQPSSQTRAAQGGTAASIFDTSSAPQPQNYLFSEEKAQRDEVDRQQKAARAAATAAAAAAAQARAQAAEEPARFQREPELNLEAAKNDNGWKKFYGAEFEREKKGMDFFSRLLDGGSASRRAEASARAKYNSELLERAYDDNGNTLDADAARTASAQAAYNFGFARDNAMRSQALTRSIGASKDNADQDFFDRAKSAVNAVRNASLYDATVGVNDATKFSIDDIGRFTGNLVQSVPTMPLLGIKELAEAAVGEGTDYETGMQRDLNGWERGGRSISGALNIALPFLPGGGVKLVDDLFGAVAKGVATQSQKQALAQILKLSASGAATQGALGGVQASGEWTGNAGTFLNDKGEIDEEKIKEYIAQVGTATALSAAGGAVFAGGGSAIRQLRDRRNLTPANDIPPAPTPAPVREVQQPAPPPPETITPPVITRPVTPEPFELPERPSDIVAPQPVETPAPRQMEPVEVTPQVEPVVRPAEPSVAPGRVSDPAEAAQTEAPVIRAEEIRALKDARAGTSQAEEAAINQRLQELAQNTPSVYRSEAPDRYGIGQAELGNGLYTGSKETAGRRQDGTISEEGLYEYKVNPEAKVLDSSSDEFRSLDSQASTHPSLKEPGISETEWRKRKTALLGQLVREAGYDGVKRGTNQFVGMSERALIPVTKGAPTYRSDAEAPTRQLDDEDRPSAIMPEYIRGEPSKQLQPNSRISKLDAPRMLRESGLDEAQVASVMSKLYKNNKGASYKSLLNGADKEAGFGSKYKTESIRESEIAQDNQIQELDRALESIQQRRAQMIADGRSENYSMVKNLDKAANDIIKQQRDIANGIRNTSTVDSENTRLFGDNANAVGYTDSIRTEGGERAVGVTKDGAGESTIIIDRNANNAEAVFHHEAVHKALNDFTTPEKRASVINSYRNHHGIDKKMTDDQVEELLSDDFAKFVADKRKKATDKANRGDVSLPTQVREFFEEVWRKIQAAYKSMKANGTLTPEFQKLYNDLNNGKYAESSVINKAVDPRSGNRYMVAGKNAKTFDPTDKAGRNFTGIENLPRFEIDDSGAKVSDSFVDMVKASQKSGRGGGEPVRLADVIDHEKLFEAYPDLADIKVSIFHEAPANGRIKYGGYSPSTDTLRLNTHPRTASELRATILHEVQHAVQKREGFARGLTETQQRALGRAQPAGEKYFRSAEEIESRLVESRRNMSQSERDATSFYDSLPADKPLGNTVIGNKDYKTMPQVHTGTRIAGEMKAAGKKPTPNKNIVREPFENNLPDSMTPNAPTRSAEPIPRKPRKPAPELTPEQKSAKEFADRFMTPSGNPQSMKQNLARALGMEKDSEIDIDDILKNTDPKTAARVRALWNQVSVLHKSSQAGQKTNRTNFRKGEAVDDGLNRRLSNETLERTTLERKLMSEIRALQRKGDIGEKVVQALENIVRGRSANMLTSASVLERAVTGDVGANIISAIKNPIKTIRGAISSGNTAKAAAKSAAEGWKVKPKTASEAYQYILGNTYRTAMVPADAAARMRRGGFRTELTKWAYRAIKKEDLTTAQAEKLSRTAGNHTEMLVNLLAGVDNFMVSNTTAMRALREWKTFIETGDSSALTRFEEIANRQATLASRLSEGIRTNSKNRAVRAGLALLNGVFPFVRVAINAVDTGVTKTLNPFSKSVLDTIRADQSTKGANVMKTLTNKMVDYGILSAAGALASAGVLAFNNGDDVDKPRGWSIDMGDGTFVPIRATPVELPLAMAGTTQQLAEDIINDKFKGADHYFSMIVGSLPYLDVMEQTTGAVDSLMNIGGSEGDDGYAAKSAAVNLGRSLTPASNNSIMPWIERNKGNSVDAKSSYDPNPLNWYVNAMKNGWNIDRDSLKDSRDAAGRIRTVDNQGSLVNKTINDSNTQTYNQSINNLVQYSRDIGMGGTQEMFNTYPDGSNNNFKSVQDSITFLDAPEVDGKITPDSAKKLEQSPKIAELNQQIYDGFFGDGGSELLTLNGQNLYSDASVPGKSGGKNSRLPLSMESIKNAIGQTDLPEDQRTRLYEIGQQKDGLYERRKAGEFTYKREQEIRAEIGRQEQEILQNSESYQKLENLMETLDEEGFFAEGGLGSTRSGQTYLWNALNNLLGEKGATPAANYPKPERASGGGGGGGGGRTSEKYSREAIGVKWTPVQARSQAAVKTAKYTPFKASVKLRNAVKKDRTQNYSDRTI